MGASVSADSGATKAPPSSAFIVHPSPVTPDWKDGKVSADPNYGFDGKKRKERVPPVTKEELASAKVPTDVRDYCAHKYIAFMKCKKDEFPWIMKCHHARHEYEYCQYEDYLIRQKEYERERRLLHRKQRKEGKKPVCEDEPKPSKC